MHDHPQTLQPQLYWQYLSIVLQQLDEHFSLLPHQPWQHALLDHIQYAYRAMYTLGHVPGNLSLVQKLAEQVSSLHCFFLSLMQLFIIGLAFVHF